MTLDYPHYTGDPSDAEARAAFYETRCARLGDLMVKAARDLKEAEANTNRIIGAVSKGEPITVDTTQLEIKISNLEAELTNAQRTIKGYQSECHDVEQNLGIALGYCRYSEDPKNFPDATEADGVCVGEHTPASISMEAAQKIVELRAYQLQADEKNTELLVDSHRLHIMREDLRLAQSQIISVFDMEHLPRFEQGAPTHEMQDVLTARDVTCYVRRLVELERNEAELMQTLDDMRMQKNSAQGESLSVKETTAAVMSELRDQRRTLQRRVLQNERIADRALSIINDMRTNPAREEQFARADHLRRALYPQLYGESPHMNVRDYVNATADTPVPAPNRAIWRTPGGPVMDVTLRGAGGGGVGPRTNPPNTAGGIYPDLVGNHEFRLNRSPFGNYQQSPALTTTPGAPI